MAGVAAIGVRQRFNPLNARMNYSHPLAAGLVFCGIPYLGVELMKNRNASSFVNERNASAFGTARRTTWDNNRTTDMSFTTGSFTIATAYNILGTVSAAQPSLRRGSYSSEGNNQGYEFGAGGTNRALFVIFRNNGSSNYMLDTTNFSRQVVQFGTSDGTTKRIYNGALQATSSTSGNLLPVDSTADVNINFGGTSASIACAWNRVLSTNEIAMYAADPYCLLSY